jgi:hypothetical protein
LRLLIKRLKFTSFGGCIRIVRLIRTCRAGRLNRRPVQPLEQVLILIFFKTFQDLGESVDVGCGQGRQRGADHPLRLKRLRLYFPGRPPLRVVGA